MKFKIGDLTNKVWAGDIVIDCEFVSDLGYGRLLFKNVKTGCFHLCFWEFYEGVFILNGWNAGKTIKELINNYSKLNG